MAFIHIIGLIAAFSLIIIGAFKNYNLIILTLTGTIILALTNQLNVMDAIFINENSYISGVASFFVDYWMIFLLAAVLAKYLDYSGAAKSIADNIIGVFGKDNEYLVLVSIFTITAILTLGGVSLYVAMFVIIPLARNIFKELNLSWKLVATPYLMGSATFTMTMIPGSPAVQNVIVSESLGTPLTAAPLLGIILAILTIIWSLWRMRVELRNSKKNNEGFREEFDSKNENTNTTNLPSFGLSIIPLILLLSIIIIGSRVGIESIIIYALMISIIVSMIIFNGYLNTHKKPLNEGAMGSLSSVIMPASAVGFGTVVSVSPGFSYILDFIQGLPLTPLLSLIILTVLLQWFIGSSAATLGIITDRFIPLYNLSGYHPEMIHRLVLVSSSYIPPQVGFLIAFYDVTGLDHKESYKDVMVTLNGSVFIFTIVGYVLSYLIY